jgi:hypothetical protein
MTKHAAWLKHPAAHQARGWQAWHSRGVLGSAIRAAAAALPGGGSWIALSEGAGCALLPLLGFAAFPM